MVNRIISEFLPYKTKYVLETLGRLKMSKLPILSNKGSNKMLKSHLKKSISKLKQSGILNSEHQIKLPKFVCFKVIINRSFFHFIDLILKFDHDFGMGGVTYKIQTVKSWLPYHSKLAAFDFQSYFNEHIPN